jgi:hypothetical protein
MSTGDGSCCYGVDVGDDASSVRLERCNNSGSMRGFVIRQADGVEVFAEATTYNVQEDGDLVLRVGEEVIRTVAAGSWVLIEPVGRPLSPSWPPDELELLLDSVRHELAVRHGYYVHRLGTAMDYPSPLLNDLEALVTEMLRRVGADATSSDNKVMVESITDLVRRHFHQCS